MTRLRTADYSLTNTIGSTRESINLRVTKSSNKKIVILKFLNDLDDVLFEIKIDETILRYTFLSILRLIHTTEDPLDIIKRQFTW